MEKYEDERERLGIECTVCDMKLVVVVVLSCLDAQWELGLFISFV